MGGVNRKSLRGQLESYYVQHVEVDGWKMQNARSVVEDIKREYKGYIERFLLDVDVEIVERGSTSEGLKVIEPDEFDIMLVVNGNKLLTQGASIVPCQYDDAGGFYFISEKKYDVIMEGLYRPSRKAWPRMSKWVDGDGFLSPEKARRAFQGLTDELFKNFTKHKISRSISGPAVTLKAEYIHRGCQEELSIDFVPAYRFGNKVYVAKPHPECNIPGCPDTYRKLWLQTFCEEECICAIELQLSGEYAKCLKILKAIRVHHMPELGSLSSYVFKTLLIHMYRNPSKTEHSIDDIFRKSLMNLQGHLENGVLNNFFDPNMNLFAFVNETQRRHVRFYLHRIIETKAWNELLIVRSQRIIRDPKLETFKNLMIWMAVLVFVVVMILNGQDFIATSVICIALFCSILFSK